MRLFIALDIDDSIRERISRFVEGVQGFAPEARWVKPESLHVTLKFIGEQPDSAVEQIKQALRTVNAATTEIHFRGYGFFPNAKLPRVFWIGIEAGPQLASLATTIDQQLTDEKMKPLGIAREERAFSPHLTLARAPGGSGKPRVSVLPPGDFGQTRVRVAWRKGDGPSRFFQRLQEKLASLPTPEFGTMTPREFFLYQSKLSPKGSKYTKLERFELNES